ncbi:hypothetical protein KQX54_001505 [Cotesia glomerata]|uniref:Uncharacterized protein n=1 Tax=Cotesia glomerata TaxID=32391 RepID=A0AAV7HXY9_COTGL|nr:hypothetical protein KQX54_001505 [Cotesia glomerata]
MRSQAANKIDRCRSREDIVHRRKREHARIRLATYGEELQVEESIKQPNKETIGKEPLVFTFKTKDDSRYGEDHTTLEEPDSCMTVTTAAITPVIATIEDHMVIITTSIMIKPVEDIKVTTGDKKEAKITRTEDVRDSNNLQIAEEMDQ